MYTGIIEIDKEKIWSMGITRLSVFNPSLNYDEFYNDFTMKKWCESCEFEIETDKYPEFESLCFYIGF